MTKPTKSTLPAESDNVVAFELTPEQFLQLSEIARVDLDVNAEALAALGADELGRAEFSVMRAGAYFLKLKAGCGHGQFEAALASAGVNPRNAQRAMQIASYVAALPHDQAKRIAGLPKSKVLPLINADQDVVRELLDEGALDGEQPLSVRELRAKLKKAEGENKTLQTRLETARIERDRALKSSKYLLAEEDLPHFALTARQEAMALTESMSFSLDMLDDVTQQSVVSSIDHPEANRFQPIVAGTLFYALGGVLARTVAHMQRLAEHFDAADQSLLANLPYSPGELKLFTEARERIAGHAKAAKVKREAVRENDRPGKAGRKRKEG